MTRMDWEAARRRETAGRPPEREAIVWWWWTIAKFARRCDVCRERIPPGATTAYNHGERSVVCEICADADGLSPKPSKAFVAARKRGRRQAA